MSAPARAGLSIVPAHGRGDVGSEIRQLRAEARARVSEVDLLVAALQDHIKDLRAERDWLRAELERARETQQLASAAWVQRGLKGSH